MGKTKGQLLDEYFHLITKGDVNFIDDRLFEACNKHFINSGALFVYSKGYTYGYRMIDKKLSSRRSGTYASRFTKRDLEYYINDIKKNAEETKTFLREHGFEVYPLEQITK